MAFTKEIEVRWSDLDANGHVTHTAYANFATHTRTSWMKEIGFPIQKLIKMGLLGVLTRETTEYYREIFLSEKVTIKVYYGGGSIDGSRWKFIHKIYKADGKLSAVNTVYGAWLNTEIRKITIPPQNFLDSLNTVEKTEDFEVIEPSN